MKFKVDLVIPYVDSSDENWIKLYNKYNPSKLKKEDSNALNRFRGQDNFLRYLFRSIDTNLSWINNLFFIVQSYSQVPDWLDQTKIKVILHEQFIPRRFLPTFNSGTIELFLHNIKDLEEHFIYINDDFYALSCLQPTDFFTESKVKFNVKSSNQDPKTTKSNFFQMCQNNNDLIFNKKNSIPYLRLGHEFRPYLKSKWAECYNNYEKDILDSLSQFRESKNLTCYLYSLYLYKINLQENSNLLVGYLSSYSGDISINRVLNNFDTICINDTDSSIDIYKNKVLNKWFHENFPYCSKYEKGYNPKLKNKPKSKHKNKLLNSSTHVVTIKTILKSNYEFTGLPEEYWKDNF